ncbi:hemagglutination protein, partial [Testudinibacter sp. TR-2022]
MTTENIDNYSDVSVQSVSGGLSTDMGNLTMTGMAAAMSALGNVSKDDSSTTQSAVSSNINLEVRNGDVPTALSRDTDNANQKVTEFDKTEYQERAEMAQVIGQISNNSIVLSLKPKLDEAQQQKADAEGVLANDNSSTEQKAAAQIQLANAEQAIAKYGKGGAIQMAVRAVTGVLQGIATGSAESAVVGGVSPYANLAIKQATEGNDSANIMAHAVLGAVEAYATGNNVAAGAVGAASGELAAKIITEQLYGTTADKLTEEQKETVSALSQIAAGLSGALVGDSTQSAVAGAEIGKRAVENNYLFKHEVERQAELLVKQNTEG